MLIQLNKLIRWMSSINDVQILRVLHVPVLVLCRFQPSRPHRDGQRWTEMPETNIGILVVGIVIVGVVVRLVGIVLANVVSVIML